MFTKNLFILTLCILPGFSTPSPLVKVQKVKEPVAGRYIVTLKDGVDREASVSTLSGRISGISSITNEWDIINGFAGTFTATELENLRSDPNVAFIEEDGYVHTQAAVTETKAPWGLGRISSKTKLANQDASALAFSYDYDTTAGKGATVFVIDTGILTSHRAFGGRASWGATFGGYISHDGDGHGTHCAGIAVSGPYGVAKSARVVAVKVLSDLGDGMVADVISGIDWVAKHRGGDLAVASLSIAGGPSTSLDNAITNLVKFGVTTVVAAGNSESNADETSPARVGVAITVGASDITDTKASFSNYGAILDVWAPGVDVISTWNNGGTKSLSGTSMATPHVSGYVAYLLGMDSSLTPSSIASILKSRALPDVLSGIPPGTPNLLLNNGF